MANPQIKYNPEQAYAHTRKAGAYENPAQLKPLADTELLDLASEGNRLAMAEIYDRHAHLCYAVALRILSSTSLAERVVQNAFLVIWRQPRTFRVQNCELPAWLVMTTRLCALAACAANGHSGQDDLMLPEADALSLGSAQIWMPEKLKRVVAAMPPSTRQTLELAWNKGLAPDAIASQFGTSARSAWDEMNAAIEIMEKALLAHE